MKKIIILVSFLLTLSITSCKKDDCISNLNDSIEQDIHYVYVGCTGHETGYGDFEWKFNSEEEYKAFMCAPINLPFEFNFDGIIVAQGVKVPFLGPGNGDPGYELSTEILKDECEKSIDFKFTLNTIDTSRRFDHMENVIVLLNGIDSTYEVNFSHEIIPYIE